jgi:hypothetical protein
MKQEIMKVVHKRIKLKKIVLYIIGQYCQRQVILGASAGKYFIGIRKAKLFNNFIISQMSTIIPISKPVIKRRNKRKENNQKKDKNKQFSIFHLIPFDLSLF